MAKEDTTLQSDADAVMEQIQMQESRHMRMSALVSYQLQYPDMTIRDFFAMASEEIREEQEDAEEFEDETLNKCDWEDRYQ